MTGQRMQPTTASQLFCHDVGVVSHKENPLEKNCGPEGGEWFSPEASCLVPRQSQEMMRWFHPLSLAFGLHYVNV